MSDGACAAVGPRQWTRHRRADAGRVHPQDGVDGEGPSDHESAAQSTGRQKLPPSDLVLRI